MSFERVAEQGPSATHPLAPPVSFLASQSSLVLPHAAVGVMIAIVALVWGRYAGGSALGGAAVAWITSLYVWSRTLAPARTLGAALGRVLGGELVKVTATIGLFAVAARVPHLVWPALLCGYAAALVGGWVAAARAAGVRTVGGGPLAARG